MRPSRVILIAMRGGCHQRHAFLFNINYLTDHLLLRILPKNYNSIKPFPSIIHKCFAMSRWGLLLKTTRA